MVTRQPHNAERQLRILEGNGDGIMNHLDAQFSAELSVSGNCIISLRKFAHDLHFRRVFILTYSRCALRWSERRRYFSLWIRVCSKVRSSIKVRDLPCIRYQKSLSNRINLALWLERTRALVSKLRSHLDVLTNLYTQFFQAGDADGCLSLQCCIVIVLTHLALNHNLLGKHSMNAGAIDDQTLCADVISHLTSVTQELQIESSMRRVHMYTGVCTHLRPRSFSAVADDF